MPDGGPTDSASAAATDASMIILIPAIDMTVLPMPQVLSINVDTIEADIRSPETPEELSSSKNIFSPASEANETLMSASYSDFQRV